MKMDFLSNENLIPNSIIESPSKMKILFFSKLLRKTNTVRFNFLFMFLVEIVFVSRRRTLFMITKGKKILL